ncbi:NADH dehydrogenase [ubiquinone] 1 beta subcomplex subunit 8, mitochondrial [Thrips palmi]|uniref:NADH dehydrogenase [ubiquinone] 1 beta subcomplex subunit 8, mitochondrial n=1 Tax=Thrips palmi TaxID=161013 RepID=A0A6P8YJ30_THRPL|nr:NADH dehydrogenase [ubiquinone] 1 beta subcomplex subunit 8, mitochondrial [Thrips palmi]
MAFLRHLVTRKVGVLQPTFLYNSARQAGIQYMDDFIPGPYPKTEKERLAAAKKYGLLPHEYKPVADDGWGKGDYPHLPDIGADSKDPNYPWDYPEFRINYGEPLHHNFEIYGEDRLDPAKDWGISKTDMVKYFVVTMALAAAIALLADPYPIHRPVCEKQYPLPGKVHYSFERP